MLYEFYPILFGGKRDADLRYLLENYNYTWDEWGFQK